MDNRQFNINGRTKKQLETAIKALLTSETEKEKTVSGWYFSKSKGLVLTWMVGQYGSVPFTDRMGVPKEIDSTELVNVLWKWLDSEEAEKVELYDWDANTDHDGHNEKGWRLYVEDWGQIGLDESDHASNPYSIAAFKPAYLWYGK